jgi:hypothetical protein
VAQRTIKLVWSHFSGNATVRWCVLVVIEGDKISKLKKSILDVWFNLRQRDNESFFFFFFFGRVHARVGGGKIRTCDIRFISRGSQSIELPLGTETMKVIVRTFQINY